MELRALVDYMNNEFTLFKNATTIGAEHISEEVKTYLLTTFPDWFVETTEEIEAAIAEEAARIQAAIDAAVDAYQAPVSPFDSDAMTTNDKQVEDIVNQEAKLDITSNDAKVKTKKK